MILDVNNKKFVVNMAIWEQEKILIFFEKYAQIRVKV